MQAIPETENDNAVLLDVSLEAARRGAEVIRDATSQRDKLVWETKGRSDFVSEVDKASEREIAAIIRRRLPEAIMLGEELSPTAIAGKGLVVIADPLDGTTNFLHGYPEYSVSIAIARDGVLCAGVVLNVARDEEFTATRGGGAFRNGKRVRADTSANARPSSVLSAPTSTASASEFHATPQLRPPPRQARPQIDRAVILSAN